MFLLLYFSLFKIKNVYFNAIYDKIYLLILCNIYIFKLNKYFLQFKLLLSTENI